MNKKISAFSFVHNALEAGYPIVEAIQAVYPYVDDVLVVDMQSTDGTPELLYQMKGMGVRVVPGLWNPGKAGQCLRDAHELHKLCYYDQIVHFEADEVYSDRLIQRIKGLCNQGKQNLNVWRVQIGQNFQRMRWHPVKVHRVFIRGKVEKGYIGPDGRLMEDHTTNVGRKYPVLSPEFGFLWDCSSTCRDNYMTRARNQAELWGHATKYRLAPGHFMWSSEFSEEETIKYLEEPHWTFSRSPFDLPAVLLPLVGKVKYEPELD